MKKIYIIIKEKGIINFLFHLIEKLIWGIETKKFKNVGIGTYFQIPYEINGANNIVLGNNVSARRRLQLETFEKHNGFKFSPQIVIGNNVSINFDVHIAAINQIVIEDNVLIASKVFITDHSHGNNLKESNLLPPSKRKLYSKGPVHIKKNVWIGEGVCIMPNVTIGINSIIAANSVVTKDIPPNCIAGGCPAKVLKELNV